MKAGLLIAFIFFSSCCFSQNPNTTIDLTRITQEKIRTMLTHQFLEENHLNYQTLEPTCRKGQQPIGYHQLESAYRVKAIPDEVWNIYQTMNPAKSWNGHMVSFGLMISREEHKVMYRDDNSFAHIDTGQVLYINLRILQGLYNLAVGLKITDIDTLQRSITYSYLKGGKSRGEQTLFFSKTRNGNTAIIHRTLFKGNSYLRDRYLYPWFHRIAINEFHRNMRKAMFAMNN